MDTITQEGQLLYSVADAAKRLSVSPATVYREIAAGRIKVMRIGVLVRIPADELRRYATPVD